MNRKKSIWLAILVLCLILLALSVVWNKKNKSPKTYVEAETAALEGTQAAETALEEIIIANEGGGPAAQETETDAFVQPNQKEDNSVSFLHDLSGIEPGTVLKKEQIDFDRLESYFMVWKIEKGDNLYDRINGKSYHENPYVSPDSLRYLKLLHYNFEGQIQVGELIVNQDITEDVIDVFLTLFREGYQIKSMYLVDNYWTGDPDSTDWASIDVNNTSAFCFRDVTGGNRLSNHAYGRAIDINPMQNPYVSYSSGKPKWSHENADPYIKRDTGMPHVITHEDTAYKVFTDHGFQWGGDWKNPKDYQHFEKKREG